ncbi:MAG: hypothetical protein ACOC4M_14535 [Promethearchaeia archaeon]
MKSNEIENLDFENPQDPELVRLADKIDSLRKQFDLSKKEKDAFKLVHSVIMDESWK